MKIYRHYIRGALLATAAALAAGIAGGCAASDPDAENRPDAGEELQLRLSIDAGAFTRTDVSSAEATALAERRIDDVLVLLFSPGAGNSPGSLWMAKKALSLTADAGEGAARRFDVRFSLSGRQDYPSSLVVAAVANPGALAAGIESKEGSALSVIRKDAAAWRSEDITDRNPLFSMWGVSPQIVQTGARSQDISMKFVRDMAKVTVSLKKDGQGSVAVAGDPEFRLAHALVYNRRTEVAMIPDPDNMDAPDGSAAGADPYALKAPSLWSDVAADADRGSLGKDEGYMDDVSPDGLEQISIYVPEQDILMGKDAAVDDENAMRRPALIVGGYYGADKKLCWYRVDFSAGRDADGNKVLADVLRNHHYRIQVSEVKGPGEETPELAYGTLQTTVETEVVDWTDVEWDAEFDGANWIAAQREVCVGASAGDFAEVILRSNVPSENWSLSWDEVGESLFEAAIAHGSDRSDESDRSDRTGVVITALQDLPEGMESRNAVLTVEVTPRLRFVINVIQTRADGSGDSDDAHDPWKDDYLYWIF